MLYYSTAFKCKQPGTYCINIIYSKIQHYCIHSNKYSLQTVKDKHHHPSLMSWNVKTQKKCNYFHLQLFMVILSISMQQKYFFLQKIKLNSSGWNHVDLLSTNEELKKTGSWRNRHLPVLQWHKRQTARHKRQCTQPSFISFEKHQFVFKQTRQ